MAKPVILFGRDARRIFRTVAAGVAVLAVAGCATYGNSIAVVERDLAARQPEQALQHLQKLQVPNTDKALYLLNEGMVLHVAGKWQDSNAAFEAAQRLMDELSAVSVREQGTSLLVNDLTRSYEGEGYDKLMLHVYKALNYLALQQPFEARVEALQMDVVLRSLAEKAGKRDPELGFARYLTGMIYEDVGEWSDAMIAYRKAYEAYQRHRRDYGVAVPESLKRDLLRLARKEGLNDELEKYQKEFAVKADVDPASTESDGARGELILVFNNGLAPFKIQQGAILPDPASGRMFRISLPSFQTRPPQIAEARLSVNEQTISTEVVEDINAVALADLNAQMPAITARSLARIVAKTKMEEQAGKDNPVAGALLNIAAVLTEEADTRSWSTLPYNIQLARLPLAPGRYSLKIELLDAGQRVVATRTLTDIDIRPEHKTFVSYHWNTTSPTGARR